MGHTQSTAFCVPSVSQITVGHTSRTTRCKPSVPPRHSWTHPTHNTLYAFSTPKHSGAHPTHNTLYAFSTPKHSGAHPTHNILCAFNTPKHSGTHPTHNTLYAFSTPKHSGAHPTHNTLYAFSTPKAQLDPPHAQHAVCLHFHSRFSSRTALDQTSGSVTWAPRSSRVCSDISVTAVLVCVQLHGNLCYVEGGCADLLICYVAKFMRSIMLQKRFLCL